MLIKKPYFQLFFFYSKHLENTLETLIKPLMTLKNLKNNIKFKNQLETKNLSELKFILSNFKVKKHLSGSPLTEYNSLTSRLTILVIEMLSTMIFFLDLRNPATLLN